MAKLDDPVKRGKSTKKIVWLSIIAIAACVAAITVTLLILYLPRDGSEPLGHIKIETPATGIENKPDVKLIREKLESKTLDKRGFTEENVDSEQKDFSATDENIFGINSKTLIGPGCGFTAHMAISDKTNLPFEYGLEIVPKNGKTLLADQLELTVTVEGEIKVKRMLADGLTTDFFPSKLNGDVTRFIVKLEYLDADDNNSTQNSTLVFDMIVHVKSV